MAAKVLEHEMRLHRHIVNNSASLLILSLEQAPLAKLFLPNNGDLTTNWTFLTSPNVIGYGYVVSSSKRGELGSFDRGVQYDERQLTTDHVPPLENIDLLDFENDSIKTLNNLVVPIADVNTSIHQRHVPSPWLLITASVPIDRSIDQALARQVHICCSRGQPSIFRSHTFSSSLSTQSLLLSIMPYDDETGIRSIWSDVTIECAEEGWECSDTLVTRGEMQEIREEAKYNYEGEAHIRMDCAFSFGTSTTILKVRRKRYYSSPFLMMSVALEFGTSKECFRFIQHDFPNLAGRAILPNEDDGARTVIDDTRTIIDDISETVGPVTHEYRHAQRAALRRGLSYDDFKEEFTEPVTQVTRRRASPANNYARPCVLMLHLEVWAAAPVADQRFLVVSAHWSATDRLPTYPSPPNPFQNLNSFHFSSPASAARSHNSSSPPHSDTLSITFSEQGIKFLDGTNSVSAVNGLTVSRGNATVVINYNRINTMADGYFGAISYSNIAGSNNTNIIRR
ncbi:hypothetical protein EYR36_010054 [Pleurotus pulmonarius]|nr:hypothetical protein EYR36_010054 [Pleurotus pulmonarius]